jgi:hypothetical protein
MNPDTNWPRPPEKEAVANIDIGKPQDFGLNRSATTPPTLPELARAGFLQLLSYHCAESARPYALEEAYDQKCGKIVDKRDDQRAHLISC